MTEIWILRMLQMWMKYKYWEYYKCYCNLNIGYYNKIIILNILQVWVKYEYWECYKCVWNVNIVNITNVTEI